MLISTSSSTGLSISPAIRQAFTRWLESVDNYNRAQLDEERYLEYNAFLIFPNSTLPNDTKNNLEAKRCGEAESFLVICRYYITQSMTA